MADTPIPADFLPADPLLCVIAKKLDGRTTKQFVAVYPAAGLIAVHDGSKIDASWISHSDTEGQALRAALLTADSTEPRALVLDLWQSRCWIASRNEAVGFLAGAPAEPAPEPTQP